MEYGGRGVVENAGVGWRRLLVVGWWKVDGEKDWEE
jgi:hypothetical protein